VANPAGRGELRVYNQFTEQFSVQELAEKVQAAGQSLGWSVEIDHVENPRVELEQHYYNPKHEKLLSLGLQPRLLSQELIDTMLTKIAEHRDLVDPATFALNVRWAPTAQPRDAVEAEPAR
jgi:UDP-sulfoquinovose synthase